MNKSYEGKKNKDDKNFNPSIETILEIPTRVPSSPITSPPHREKQNKTVCMLTGKV